MKKRLDRYLIMTFILVIIYTIVTIIFQAVTGNELSPTLTQWFYTFFGVEIGASAFIKVFNIKKGD